MSVEKLRRNQPVVRYEIDTSHFTSAIYLTADSNAPWNGRSWANTKTEVWRSDIVPVNDTRKFITIPVSTFFDRNGRDVHRELCGFMFLSDESMTIYEFRQFGQRLSALPLIPRAVYHHPVGRRNGDKYELRQIKKVQ